MAKTNIAEFVQQVRQELARVTWPTRKETMVTTGMVFVMVFVAALPGAVVLVAAELTTGARAHRALAGQVPAHLHGVPDV